MWSCKRRILIKSLIFVFISCILMALVQNKKTTQKQKTMETNTTNKSNEEWRKILTPEEYAVLREGGTERAFTGKYTDLKADGNYYCKGCGNLLFSSNTKFHSGCGWPSFYDVANNAAIETRKDYSHGMERTEVLCKKCHSHLGHVFNDGPQNKTGMRYCINSICLDFKE